VRTVEERPRLDQEVIVPGGVMELDQSVGEADGVEVLLPGRRRRLVGSSLGVD
jgi:hypothetical protein